MEDTRNQKTKMAQINLISSASVLSLQSAPF